MLEENTTPVQPAQPKTVEEIVQENNKKLAELMLNSSKIFEQNNKAVKEAYACKSARKMQKSFDLMVMKNQQALVTATSVAIEYINLANAIMNRTLEENKPSEETAAE